MLQQFRHDLDMLMKSLLMTSSLIEGALEKSLKALRERKTKLCLEVIEGDTQIDRFEVQIEEQCINLLALHQPVAQDLRFITAALKMNSDIERIGDLAVKIAKRARDLSGLPQAPIPEMLDTMADAVIRMVRQCSKAFIKQDVALARQICNWDEQIDSYNREIIKELLKTMRSRPNSVDWATQLLSVSKSLERVGDHTTNIAENVICLVEGQIVRHQFEGKPWKKVTV